MKNTNKTVVDKKNNNDRSKKMNISVKKYSIKPRFYIFLLAIVVLTIIISINLILSSLKITPVIDSNLDTSHMNVSKYSKQIKEQYETDGEKSKFIEEYNKIQSAVGIYIMDNSTLDQNSFSQIVKKIKSELSKSDWKNLNIEKSTYWSGNWTIDDSGNVKFKFSQKSVEPSWSKDEEVSNIITLN